VETQSPGIVVGSWKLPTAGYQQAYRQAQSQAKNINGGKTFVSPQIPERYLEVTL